MRSRFPATGAFILALSAAGAAPAQDDAAFLQKVNDLYTGPDRAVPDARRSDLVLIPALTKMTPPPEGVDTPLRAALATPKSAAWSGASEWAAAAPQQAVIEALRKVGEPVGSGRTFAFLMPYGMDNVAPEARDAGIFVRVGDPPILAAADFAYLGTLTNAAALVNVEATRLASDGKAPDAATLLVRWTLFCRQMADREFFAEKHWALRHAVAGLQRLRDLVHEYPDQFSGAGLADLIASLSEDNLGVERLQIPRANLIAGQQIIARAFVERQGPSDAFGATMARASAGDRPLRLFGEASRWQDLAAAHATTYETGDALTGVFGDWVYRWRLPEFDRVRKQSSDFDRLTKDKFAAVHLVADGVQEMFDLRQRFRAEAEGTRLALGVEGYRLDNGVFPRSLAAVRPVYVKTIGADPYSESGQEFHFFVPVRDQPHGVRDLPKPHDVTVTLPEGFDVPNSAAAPQPEQSPEAPAATPESEAKPASRRKPGAKPDAAKPSESSASPAGSAFTVGLTDQTFILYSAGVDQNRAWASKVGENAPDFLIWPPVLSLYRDARDPETPLPAAEWLWISPSTRGAAPTNPAQ